MKSGYSRIAKIYDQLARLVFGEAILRSQIIFFNQLEQCQDILVVGGGTGLWLNDLLNQFPHLKITFLDSSPEMICLAKEKLKSDYSVNFICSSIELFSTEERYDAVLLFYFLDLFEENDLKRTLVTIKRKLKLNSLWLVTDFVNERIWHRVMLGSMYLFFRVTTGLRNQQLPDWSTELKKSGLLKQNERSFYRGFIRSAVYQLDQ